MSERDLTSEEIRALEELADLAERDPDAYRQAVREARAEVEQREHAETLLGMFENATQRRQEQDREFLQMLVQAQRSSPRNHADEETGRRGDEDLGGDAA